jgi:hypothetical protein
VVHLEGRELISFIIDSVKQFGKNMIRTDYGKLENESSGCTFLEKAESQYFVLSIAA